MIHCGTNMKEDKDIPGEKISPEFAARLGKFEPRDLVYAIVLLNTVSGEQTARRRLSHAELQDTIEARRGIVDQALREIDDILDLVGGRRSSESPDVLGSLAVETTASGIYALAASEWVRAIIEDQETHLALLSG